MALKEKLKYFADIFGRNGADIGSLKYVENENEMPNQLDFFYESIIFEKVLTIGGEMFINIPPKSKLEKMQEGWYSVKNKEGEWVNDNENWNKDWIVFASRNDDAIYYNKSDNSIGGSIDKKIQYKLANSLEQFFEVLTGNMKLEFEKYNFKTRNEAEDIDSVFLEDVSIILRNSLDNKSAEDFMEFFFG